MSYSRQQRMDKQMSQEKQEDLALYNHERGISTRAIAQMLGKTTYMTERLISNAKVRCAEEKAQRAEEALTENMVKVDFKKRRA